MLRAIQALSDHESSESGVSANCYVGESGWLWLRRAWRAVPGAFKVCNGLPDSGTEGREGGTQGPEGCTWSLEGGTVTLVDYAQEP